jgi:hypothetical protein
VRLSLGAAFLLSAEPVSLTSPSCRPNMR